MRTEKRSSPQISGDMVLLHNMVSPQNGDTRGGPPPLATPLVTATGLAGLGSRPLQSFGDGVGKRG